MRTNALDTQIHLREIGETIPIRQEQAYITEYLMFGAPFPFIDDAKVRIQGHRDRSDLSLYVIRSVSEEGGNGIKTCAGEHILAIKDCRCLKVELTRDKEYLKFKCFIGTITSAIVLT